jgi:DUF1365 family protein
MQSGIYEGSVRHRRFEPVRHQFRSKVFLMYLDLDELPTLFRGRWFWSVERRNIATFRRRDHTGDVNAPLGNTIRNLVESETGQRPDGPIRLLTHLSYFGYCFNPLSIFFCFDQDGRRLQSVVAEVTNTPWGERHCYVLSAPGQDPESTSPNAVSTRKVYTFAKAMHVSPFMPMDILYRWSLTGPGNQLVLHAENCQGDRSMFDATLTLHRREITTWSLARVLLRYPLMTLQVIVNIHWQALRLWWKKIPYVPHPETCQVAEDAKNVETSLTDPTKPWN